MGAARAAQDLARGTRPILLPVVLSCAVIFPAHTSSAMLVFLTSLVMMLIGRVRVSELVRLVGLACAALLLAGCSIWAAARRRAGA